MATDRKTLVLGLAAVALAMSTAPAHAYLDPGSGGMLVQLALGGAAGLLLVFKLTLRNLGVALWKRATAFKRQG